jgi:hypothetical protein
MNERVVHLVPRRAGRRRLSIALGLGVAACAPSPDHDAFFPLAPGHHWTYRIVTARDEAEPQSESVTLYTRGSETLNGEPAWRRHADSGIDYWLRSDASGIYRVARRGPLDRAPRMDEARRYVLKQPYAVGTEWQGTTTAYVMQRRNEVPRELSRVHPSLPIAWRIVAVGEQVQTPAGRFAGCVRVAGRAEIKLWVDESRTYRDVPLLSTEWYCPQVGLVRVERQESSPSKFFVGGRLVMELTAWG